MRTKILLSTIALILGISIAGCNSNKISCPTYANSFPDAKKKSAPGKQKPKLAKHTRARSGVLPTDGKSKRTVLPY